MSPSFGSGLGVIVGEVATLPAASALANVKSDGLFATTKEPFIEGLLQHSAETRDFTSWRRSSLVRIRGAPLAPSFNAAIQRAQRAFSVMVLLHSSALLREHRRHRLQLKQIVQHIGNVAWRRADSGAVLLLDVGASSWALLYVQVDLIPENTSTLYWVYFHFSAN